MDTDETTENDFNSALQDGRTLFSSHTKNILSLIDLENNNKKIIIMMRIITLIIMKTTENNNQ